MRLVCVYDARNYHTIEFQIQCINNARSVCVCVCLITNPRTTSCPSECHAVAALYGMVWSRARVAQL